MKIQNIRTVPGPNVYSHKPVLVMQLNLEDLNEKESYEVPGFIDRLLALLPGVQEHHCGLGRAGGFVERLHGGTYFGHIVEHVALELTDPVGISTNRGKTVSCEGTGCYLVAVTYKAERAMRFLLEVAVELVQALVDNQPYPLEEKLQQARGLVADYELGPSTRAIVDAAERRGIPWSRMDENSLVRLGHGRHLQYVQATMSGQTRQIAVELAGNKDLTKQVLSKAALPVPRGCVVKTAEDAIACLATLEPPLVLKPLDGNQGKGVSLNLAQPEDVREAFALAAKISDQVIVEEMYRGIDYRVVLVGGKIVAAAQRIPAHVWGDGVHTIRDLIDQTNRDPRRGNDHEKPLTKIYADPIVLAILRRAGHTLDDTPAKGEMILLRESANLSTGGSARDVTDHVHPSIRKICERTARLIGLDICGIDLVLPDIAQPFSRGGIVEVNAAPGIRMHHHPTEGQPRDVGAAIVEMLYPAGAPSRIPIISITGTNGKTTVTRMIRHVLASSGETVGMTTTDGIWIGADEIARGDMTGPWSAGVVLSDSTVDVAVLETARGGIVRSGLGYDWSDISVMTNIQADHIGQDGIETIEDIARIKQLVAERVREGGALILNADDEHLVQMPHHPKVAALQKQIVYFSLEPNNLVVKRHIAEGGIAFIAHGDWITEHGPGGESRIIRVSGVPATFGGTADFQTYNVLAAIAACRAYGLHAESIANALQTFRTDRDGMGRVNVYRRGDGYVVVDYGHNPAALRAVCRMVAHWGRNVTGILTAPGDRSDSLIEESGRALSCGLARVIVREDLDLRGRKPGEVARLLSRVLHEADPELRVDIILDEIEAVATAVRDLQAGDVVIAFCDRVSQVTQWLLDHGAQPVDEFEFTAEVSAAAPLPAA
jgi:cyanophycin synthetase